MMESGNTVEIMKRFAALSAGINGTIDPSLGNSATRDILDLEEGVELLQTDGDWR